MTDTLGHKLSDDRDHSGKDTEYSIFHKTPHKQEAPWSYSDQGALPIHFNLFIKRIYETGVK